MEGSCLLIDLSSIAWMCISIHAFLWGTCSFFNAYSSLSGFQQALKMKGHRLQDKHVFLVSCNFSAFLNQIEYDLICPGIFFFFFQSAFGPLRAKLIHFPFFPLSFCTLPFLPIRKCDTGTIKLLWNVYKIWITIALVNRMCHVIWQSREMQYHKKGSCGCSANI